VSSWQSDHLSHSWWWDASSEFVTVRSFHSWQLHYSFHLWWLMEYFIRDSEMPQVSSWQLDHFIRDSYITHLICYSEMTHFFRDSEMPHMSSWQLDHFIRDSKITHFIDSWSQWNASYEMICDREMTHPWQWDASYEFVTVRSLISFVTVKSLILFVTVRCLKRVRDSQITPFIRDS